MIKLAIVEDNIEYRNALVRILQNHEELEVISELDDCVGLLAKLEDNTPDVVIMDIDLPVISGIAGVWHIKQKWPDVKILILSVFEDIDKIFGAIKAGANGYLIKKDPPNKIIKAIFSVHAGEGPINGLIAAKVLEYFKQKVDAVPKLDEYNLTEREKEILNKLIQGLGYKQIASECSIARETLNSHMKNIYRKLNVHSRAEVAAKFSGHLYTTFS